MKKLVALMLVALVAFSNVEARTIDLNGTKSQDNPIIIKVNAHRTVFFSGVVDMESVAQFKKDMMKVYTENRRKEIFIIVNSPGGFVSDGLSVLGMMDSMKATAPITCIVDNKAYSMAAVFITSCSKIYMTEGSSVLFHEAYQMGNGKETPNSLLTASIGLMMLNMKIGKIVAINLGMKFDEYMNLIVDGEWILNASEGYRVGLSDGTAILVY